METSPVLIEIRDAVAHITINRPEKLNALNKAVLDNLASAIVSINQNEQVRVAVITGSGSKAFVAGADIAEFRHYTAEQGKQLAKHGQTAVFDAIEHSSKPFIAAINGFALGGGLELALACHIRIASINAKMGLPEVSLGLIPGYGGTQRLAQLVGKGKAFEIIATAEMLTAQEAHQIGLVNHVVEPDELMDTAIALATKIKLRAPLAVAKSITAINHAFSSSGLAYETEAFGACFDTQDFKTGVNAFLEKKKANFKGL